MIGRWTKLFVKAYFIEYVYALNLFAKLFIRYI